MLRGRSLPAQRVEVANRGAEPDDPTSEARRRPGRMIGRHSGTDQPTADPCTNTDALVTLRRPSCASGQGRGAGRTLRPPGNPTRGVAPQVFDTRSSNGTQRGHPADRGPSGACRNGCRANPAYPRLSLAASRPICPPQALPNTAPPLLASRPPRRRPRRGRDRTAAWQ